MSTDGKNTRVRDIHDRLRRNILLEREQLLLERRRLLVDCFATNWNLRQRRRYLAGFPLNTLIMIEQEVVTTKPIVIDIKQGKINVDC
jgi:hypothetical protein